MARPTVRLAGVVLSLAAGLLLAPVHEPVDAAVVDVTPTRVLDTRAGVGAAQRAVTPGETVQLRIGGVSVSGETTVLLNLTNDGAAGPGHVSVWSCADPAPATSILNFLPGRSTPNMVAVRYTSDGVCLSASTSVHLIADLIGVTTQGDLRATRPNRVLDTRTSSEYVGGRQYRLRIAGTPGIPSNAAAAALNVTIVTPRAAGHAIVQPCDGPSEASTVNFVAGEVVPHFTFVGLTGGDVCITSTSTTHVVVDSFGWLPADSDIQLINPDRLLDTRVGYGAPRASLGDGDTVRLRVAGRGGVTNTATGATLNVVAVGAGNYGFVSVRPCDRADTVTSTVNLWPGATRANQAIVSLPSSGEICLRARVIDGGRVDLVVDAVAYTSGDVSRPAPPAEDPLPPLPAPPPPSGRFTTLPVGAALPSGEECAARVRPAAEIRPDNAAANARRGSRANANNRTDWAGFDRVDGNFAGTTDEIIQWAACKWGIDEDMARAQVVKESWWYQSANGDNGESWGLGQVRDTAHPSAFEYSVNARNSSAYNLDYTYAVWRACYEGVYGWLNTVERGATYGPGDAWGCMGVWFSGRWYTQWAINYIEGGETNGYGDRGVKQHYQLRTWEDPNFVNG